VGAMAFGSLCRALETSASDATFDQIDDLLRQAQIAFCAARREIEQVISTALEAVS